MRELVETTLKELGKYSPDAVNLILGTIAQESHYGKYRKQLGEGPALGICQIEPATFNDCIVNYINYRHELKRKILEVSGVSAFSVNDLYLNDRLSICMARVKYMRDSQPIPNTIEGYAEYYKRIYNTVDGRATEAQFIDNYKKYVIQDTIR